MRRFVVLLLLAGIAPGARPGDKPATWIEVRSPHFVALSDGGEPMARQAAEEFEKVRAVFEQRIHRLQLDADKPTVILALKNESSMKKLLPTFWAKRGAMRPAGVFFRAPNQPGGPVQKNYAVVRMDLGSFARHVVFHEYVHELVSFNYRHLPPWLNEGIAEFYGNAEVGKREVTVGMADPNAGYLLRNHTLIPLRRLLDPKAAADFYADEIQAQLFYAQSWFLTHYLIFGNGMGSGQRLNQYIALLEAGADPMDSFEKTFGDLNKLDNELRAYLQRNTLPAFKINMPATFDQMQFESRQLPPEEAEGKLAEFSKDTIPK